MVSSDPAYDAPAASPGDPLRFVVVPVDGTENSTRAVPLATRLATALDAELVLVSVIESFRENAPDRVQRLRELLADVPATVERRVVQSRLVAGTIAEESVGGIICLAATAEPFDRDGFRHSITDQLVAASVSPVIVIGPKCPVDTALTKVVVAIDPDHNQAGLAYWATRVGYALSVPVEFLHVADEAPRDLRSDVRHVRPTEGQSVAECLNEHASGALLAMGSHGRTGFRRLVEGSVGGAVISTATEPVMILGPNTSRPT